MTDGDKQDYICIEAEQDAEVWLETEWDYLDEIGIAILNPSGHTTASLTRQQLDVLIENLTELRNKDNPKLILH